MKEGVKKLLVGVSEMSALEPTEGEPEGGARALRAMDSEVLERPVRRRFTGEYKLRILREADRCMEPGQMGALLRREGLYSSNLTTWCRQLERGMLEGLSPRKRGKKVKPVDWRDRRIRELERDNERLRKRLEQAEVIIEFQKKVSDLLGISLKEGEI